MGNNSPLTLRAAVEIALGEYIEETRTWDAMSLEDCIEGLHQLEHQTRGVRAVMVDRLARKKGEG